MKTLLSTFVLLLCNLTLFAQTGQSPRILHAKEKSAIHVPPLEIEAGLKTIYSNLGAKTDLYNSSQELGLMGPNVPKDGGHDQFDGMAFTPKTNSHVSQVRVAIQYGGSGANQVSLSIYGDSDGIPGTLLAGPVTVTNLPDNFTCCTLAVATFTPVALTGGTQYWVVANTPLTGTGSDFFGGWNTVAKPDLRMAYMSGEVGEESWFAQNADLLAAGEVLGTIP
ncbi:MAG: choice-of-anchor R domain-containing protein [Terriglobales bacterium]|jgi:hypothetical protein